MKRLSCFLGFSAALLMFIGISSVASADAMSMFGASSRAAAMGGAMVAISEGPESVYYNASSLGLSSNATSFQITNLDARLYINGVDYGPGGVKGTLGFSQRIIRDRIGLGFLLPQVDLAGGKEAPESAGSGYFLLGLGDTPSLGWPMYSNPIIPLYYGVSFRLHDTLSVAISQSLIGMSYIRLMPIVIDLDGALESLLGLSLGGEFAETNYSLHLGLSWEPAEPGYSVTFRPLKYISFGYAYQGKADMDFYLPITLKSSLLAADMVMVLIYDVLTEPPVERMGVGIHIPLPRSELTFAFSQDSWKYGDLYEDRYDEWKHYSRPIRFGAGEQLVEFPKPSPMDNTDVGRYGVEYILGLKGWLPDFLSKRNPTAAIRAGFFHWESPYPDDKLWGGDFDLDADVYSGGLGFNFDRKSKSQVQDPTRRRWMSIDLHFQYFKMEERDYKLSYNEWGRPIGPTQVYYYHTEGEIMNMGFQFTWWH